MTSKISYTPDLSDSSQSSNLWAPIECVENLVERMKSGDLKGTKRIFAICVIENGEKDEVTWVCSNMNIPEAYFYLSAASDEVMRGGF